MKFYGNGAVWDASRSKILCRFVKGEYETDSKDEINKLSKMGFKHDEIEEVIEEVIEKEAIEEIEEVSLENLSYKDLKNLAKEKNVPNYHKLGKNKLIKQLTEQVQK